MRRLPVLVAVGLGVSAATVCLETALCWLLLDRHPLDVVMVYLLGVVLLAVRFGYAASLPGTALSVLAFDFFFTPPYLSFDVQDKRLLLTFVLMAFVATVISDQTARIVRREVRTAKLYAMSRELTVARSPEEMARVASRHISEAFGAHTWIVLGMSDGAARSFGPAPTTGPPPESILATARALLASGGGGAADTVSRGSGGGGDRLVALRGIEGPVGVIALRPPGTGQLARISEELLEAFASQLALALERARLADETQRAQLEVRTERLRNALLSSVSHDLRTPLGVIKGAVTAVIEQGTTLSASRKSEHLQTISEETTRLDRLLRNLLSMTSLEAGVVHAHKEWQPLEEVIGVALNRLDEQLGPRKVVVEIDPSAALAPFDAALIEQVLTNLVENATKHTAAGLPVRVGARRVGDEVEVEVADEGPGVPPEQREAIFEKFHRAAESTPGMGLGLTICRGIVTAHGGRIWCEGRAGRGAVFRFTLPAPGSPQMRPLPEAPDEPEMSGVK